ncbi:autotransporter domain-containing protein [Achromobacter sp. Marseille-Q0513]|uniref:autotransporter domain-containing protein n=1 Tax=Achromobacter sp. Marseille-Q0513 TaxID=2829161 RepID=UPI001B9BCEE0|nr:autotransporter domain-containing protein [Achromobacter sp. Marseille-Q0513]MBR8653872.1 autotransporter domain-containing protein [Achromobacter sp. Marseille-Q0513]
MNHIYRLVWNNAVRAWQPVSEFAAQARGGRASAGLCAPMRWPRHALAVALALGLSGWSGMAAAQNCRPDSVPYAIICDSTASPMQPTYNSTGNDTTITVTSTGSLGVLVATGGTALTVQGRNTSVDNAGKIDALLLGPVLPAASSGIVFTSAIESRQNIGNRANGLIRGAIGLYSATMPDLAGLAIAVRNAPLGVTTISNQKDGLISAGIIAGVTRGAFDAPVIAAYGGGQVQVTNYGTIVGRIALEAPSGSNTPGNTFTNAGNIQGSLSMGAGGNNVFKALPNSSVTGASGNGDQLVAGQSGLRFVRPGRVDGGGAGSTLVLDDPAQNGISTNISGWTYVNFGKLTVNDGNWRLADAPLTTSGGDVTLKGGVVTVDDSGVLGTGVINAQGGRIASSVFRSTLTNDIVLGAGGLTTSDANQLVLSGKLSGTGGLTLAGTGQVTLGGANDYSGGTTVQTDATLLGDSGSLQGNIHNNGQLFFMQSSAGTYGGVLSGTGTVNKNGAGTLTLTGANTTTGTFSVGGGTLAIGAGGSLSSNATVWLGANTAFDLSAAGDQSIGGLSGTGNVTLGGSALTLAGNASRTYGGVISGTGTLTKTGTGTQTLDAANVIAGGVVINGGTLKLGTNGSLAPNAKVTVNTGGVFDVSSAQYQTLSSLYGTGGEVKLGGLLLTLESGSFGGTISGSSAGLMKTGAGLFELNGAATYDNQTMVNSGTLMVGSTSAYSTARISGDVYVASGGTIGGFGKVDGNVTVATGGHLTPGAPGGVFTVGALTLEQGSTAHFSLGAPGADFGTPGAGHSVSVKGDLTLSGVRLDILNGGGYGPGLYRLFDYDGTLTTANGGLFTSVAGQTLQILSGAKQINLINTVGIPLAFWNANGLASPTQMGGGSGTWSATAPTWTNANGSVTGLRYPADAFSIFGGAAGTVTIDNTAGAVQAQGMQFAGDGYHLNGDALELVAPGAGQLSEIRVGDGGATSAGWTTIIDNVLSGNGLNKTGAGTLVLNGANTYTQATRLSAGTLSVSSDANLGAAANGLDFQGGTLRVTGTAMQGSARNITWGAAGGGFDIADAGNTYTVTQALAGSGGLNKLGAGTLVLNGNNGYTGATRVAGGTLQVGDGGTAGVIAGDADIQAGATLAFKRSDNLVYGGALSGAGQLRQQGTGTLTLTGNNSYSGNASIDAGTLQIGDGGTTGGLAGNVANNGTLIFNRSDDVAYAGSLSGSGATRKLGAGTLTLSGDSSAYTGAASVVAGTLQVDGKLGGKLLAASGTTLSGTGTLNNVIVASGATLAPGNAATPMGTMTLRGDLIFAPGSSYRVAASADGQHSRVDAAGQATLAGSVLHVGANGNYAPSTTYTILTAGGGVQGRFDTVSSNLAFLTPTLAYEGQRVDLVVKTKEVPGDNGGNRPIEFADAAGTGNQRAVARALQSLPKDSPLYRRVLNLPNGAPAGAFDGLSGETHSTSSTMLQGAANTFVQLPMTRLRANLNAGLLPGVPTAQLGLGDAAALPQAAAQPLWAQVFGNWGTMRGDGNAAKTTQTDSGITIGGDHAIGGGWRLGGALGYTNSRSSTGDRGASAKADSYSLTIYGGKAFDVGSAKLNFSLGTAYTWHDMSTRRNTDAAGLPQTLEASYHGNTAQVFTELGYAIPVTERVTLEPFVGAGYSSLRTRAFTESGGDAALRGDSNRNNVATTTLGLHARSAFESAGARGQVHGTLGWRHAYGDVNPASTLSFVQGGASFTANGVPVARDAALVELGVNMAVSKRTTVGVSYGGQFGDGNRQHTGTLDVRYRY